MPNITCGNCHAQHSSVDEVKACYAGAGRATTTTETSVLASDKQTALIHKLLVEKAVLQEEADRITAELPMLNKRDASQLIGSLIAKGPRPVARVPITSPVPTGTPADAITEGMYRVGERVYKVQRAVNGSGHLYAKALEGNTFVYARGAMALLRIEDKMTLEDAKKWGVLYGTCCVCGRTLTDETSIANGIGPVCAGKGWW